MKTVIVSGAIANKPFNGGEAWVRLSWIRGMQRLGFRTVFIEQADSLDEAARRYFDSVMRGFQLQGALVGSDGRATRGEVPASADLLINISGNLRSAGLLERVRKTIYLDIDPGYTQIWDEQGTLALGGHDFYYSIAENIGAADCTIPTAGVKWRTIRQPVVLDDWPVVPSARRDRFTTVAAWRGSFGTLAHEGVTYGQKCHEFRKVIDLPKRTKHGFEIVLQIHDGDAKDRAALQGSGWNILDPKDYVATPDSFRQYVQSSASAEFSVAQGIYVATHSAWFSDRTTRYLASGKPALVQETGFSRHIPASEGLISFTNLDEAIAGADDIVANYETHSRAARAIAEKYFDSDKILRRLCEEVGVLP